MPPEPNPLSLLPSVHRVLEDASFREAGGHLAEEYRTRLVRAVLDERRRELLEGAAAAGTREGCEREVLEACIREARLLGRASPRRVVNGTGVLVHTNLGRAPLGPLLGEGALERLAGYTDLEWDAETQQRGDRDAPLRRQLQLLTGAEAALVVNNCAAALVLALDTLAAGREVPVSRSELVEIGGSFRVPEIMEASGCRLVEVGTTNRTRIEDFRRATGEGTAALLKVHQSNFVQRGFVEQVPVEAMVALGRELGIPVVEDNGSGLLHDPVHPALEGEPRVAESLRHGVDVVCCSGDKLMGGVQAGVLLGRAEPIGRMRRNPLYRVLRLDKVRMALLDGVLRHYLAGEAASLPLWRLFHASVAELEARVAELRLPGGRWRSLRGVPLRAALGGGSSPEVEVESYGLELEHRDHGAEALRRRFAAREVPIAGYVRGGRFHLDFRGVLPGDLPEVQAALDALEAPSTPVAPEAVP